MPASIPSPSFRALELGPLSLNVYGLMLAIGVLVAWRVAETRWRHRGNDPKDINDLALWIIVAGVVGARVYHLFTGYDWDRSGLSGTVRIWEGGLSIWGAVLGGAIAVVILTRVRHLDTLVMMDCIAPGLAFAQAIGRWGNYFNQELFGRPTDRPWGLEIDVVHRPVGYEVYETFHPTFLYESIYCVLLAGAIFGVERRFRLRKGQAFALYVALYTFGRFFLENLRIDEASKLGPLRFNAWVSVGLFVFGVAWFVWLGRHGRPYEDVGEPEPEGPGADLEGGRDRRAVLEDGG